MIRMGSKGRRKPSFPDSPYHFFLSKPQYYTVLHLELNKGHRPGLGHSVSKDINPHRVKPPYNNSSFPLIRRNYPQTNEDTLCYSSTPM
jgi:hypothetical protein